MGDQRQIPDHEWRKAIVSPGDQEVDDLFADDFDRREEQATSPANGSYPATKPIRIEGKPPPGMPSGRAETWRWRLIREGCANSLWFPSFLAIYLLAFRPGLGAALYAAVPLLILVAIIQASVLAYRQQPSPIVVLAGNGIGPLATALAGWALLPGGMPPCLLAVYGASAMASGSLQAGRTLLPERMRAVAIGLEDMLRMVAFLALLAVICVLHDIPGAMPQAFLAMAAGSLGLISVLLGAVRAMDAHHLERSRQLMGQMATLSDWSMGTSRIRRAVTGRVALHPERRIRAVLFGDIRGFTAWSESRAPEQVLDLLHRFYVCAEQSWGERKTIKSKFTADEVMMVFDDPLEAAATALALVERTRPVLSEHGLGIGVGLHHGPLIEGLFGSDSVKTFDVLGDTVNTGKRVCDQAKAGEVLCTFLFYSTDPDRLVVSDTQHARAKGKSQPLVLARLMAIRGDEELMKLSRRVVRDQPPS